MKPKMPTSFIYSCAKVIVCGPAFASIAVCAAALSIATTSPLPAAAQGVTYSQTLTARSATAATWVVTSGALPAGLSLASTTGVISGAPTATGVFTFSVSATDEGASTSKQLSLTVNAPVSVSLTPSSVSLLPSQSQTFTATVGGTANTNVTWSFNPAIGSLAGSATTSVYVAPSTAPTTQTVTVTAISVANSKSIATAVITLPETVTVSLSPATVSLAYPATQKFTATVVGTTNTAVTWSINPALGTISSTGLYTPPPNITSPQIVTVTAQSAAAPSTSASAIVTLGPVTYYVDSINGADSNAGSQSAPWKTIAKVNAATLLPGQTVEFKRGGIWREQLTVPSSGSMGSPIIFGAYGTGSNPEIAGSNLITGWTQVSAYPSTYEAAAATAPSNVYVDDPNTGASTIPLTLEKSISAVNATPGSWYYAGGTIYVQLTDSSNPSAHTIEASVRSYGVYSGMHSFVTVQNLSVKHTTVAAIYFENTGVPAGTSGSYYNNNFNEYITIQGNTVWNYGAAGSPYSGGIYLTGYAWGSPPMLRGEQVINNVVGRMDSSGTLNYDEGGIELRGTTGALIQGNTVATMNNFGITARDGYGGQTCSSPVVTQNAVSSSSGNISIAACPGAQVTYNTVSNSTGYGIGIGAPSGSPSDNVVLAYNLIYDLNISPNGDLYNGIDINDASLNGSAYNNTIYSVAAASLTLEGGSSGWMVENNIFDASLNPDIFGQTNVTPCLYVDTGVTATFTNNLFYTSSAKLPNQFNLVGKGGYVAYATFHADLNDTGSVANLAPLFTSPLAGNFTLQTGSPAIGAGLVVPNVTAGSSVNIGAK
jgi:hypothetical protein